MRRSYELLEVPPSATSEEIKRAYWAKAKQWHPDLRRDEYSREQMIRLNQARELLSRA